MCLSRASTGGQVFMTSGGAQLNEANQTNLAVQKLIPIVQTGAAPPSLPPYPLFPLVSTIEICQHIGHNEACTRSIRDQQAVLDHVQDVQIHANARQPPHTFFSG